MKKLIEVEVCDWTDCDAQFDKAGFITCARCEGRYCFAHSDIVRRGDIGWNVCDPCCDNLEDWLSGNTQDANPDNEQAAAKQRAEDALQQIGQQLPNNATINKQR